jgi:hypothetical protein
MNPILQPSLMSIFIRALLTPISLHSKPEELKKRFFIFADLTVDLQNQLPLNFEYALLTVILSNKRAFSSLVISSFFYFYFCL